MTNNILSLRKLWTKQSRVPEDFYQTLLDLSANIELQDTEVYNSSVGQSKDPEQRKGKYKSLNSVRLPPYYSDIVFDLINTFHPDGAKNYDLVITENALLFYEEGDHFKVWHQDQLDKSRNKRLYTIITLLEYSDDAVGGNLLIKNPDDESVFNPTLRVGDTVVFPSECYHRVSTLQRGKRVVLNTWVGI